MGKNQCIWSNFRRIGWETSHKGGRSKEVIK
jgi:hypothetical protein